jgi:hypothetical protein
VAHAPNQCDQPARSTDADPLAGEIPVPFSITAGSITEGINL